MLAGLKTPDIYVLTKRRHFISPVGSGSLLLNIGSGGLTVFLEQALFFLAALYL